MVVGGDADRHAAVAEAPGLALIVEALGRVGGGEVSGGGGGVKSETHRPSSPRMMRESEQLYCWNPSYSEYLDRRGGGQLLPLACPWGPFRKLGGAADATWEGGRGGGGGLLVDDVADVPDEDGDVTCRVLLLRSSHDVPCHTEHRSQDFPPVQRRQSRAADHRAEAQSIPAHGHLQQSGAHLSTHPLSVGTTRGGEGAGDSHLASEYSE